MDRPTAPAPAIATFISASRSSLGGSAAMASASAMCPAIAAMYTWSPAWMTVFGVGQQAGAEPDHERHPAAGRGLQVGDPVAHPVLVQRELGDADVAGRVAPLGGLGLAGQHVEQPVGGPRHGRHRRDAQPLVDRGALGVVDAGDDALARRTSRGPPAPR